VGIRREVTPKELRAKGDELKARLDEIAGSLQKLSGKGWEYDMGLYDIMLSKNISKAAAEKEPARLGIDGEVYEWEDE